MTADMEQYREHLDWHFRQNRREKDEMKVSKFRQWYYHLTVSTECLIFPFENLLGHVWGGE